MTDLAIVDQLDWDGFIKRYWDRRPVLVNRLQSAPFEASEVFEAAARGTTRLDASRILPPGVQFTIGREQQVEPGPWLPERSDGSFSEYNRRLARQLGRRRYSLVVQTLHAYYYPQWKRQCAFYVGLWKRVGLPAASAITTLFHGSYEHSPVGVHRDRFSTFMYALSGHKRMRFWEARPWTEQVSTVLDYEQYLDSSFTVDVGPGQLLYWPHYYYHVGESDLDQPDHPATSVNVGIRREGHIAEYDLRDLIYELAPEPVAAGEDGRGRTRHRSTGLLAPPSTASADLDDELPDSLVVALDAFKAGFEGRNVRRRSADMALRRWTSEGFQPAPPPDPHRPVTDRDTVRATAPVLWTRTDGTCLCAANGHTTTTTLSARRLASLVAELRSGFWIRVGDRTTEERRLLEDLESFRALTRPVDEQQP